MDYGKRKYGTSKKSYIEYASEITDQYIKSIGGVHKADFKRPYKADDYHSMMYSFDTPMKYLGGTLPTLESLNLAPVATVETPTKYFSKWTERQPKGDIDANWYCCCADYDGSVFLVGDSGNLYRSGNAGKTWDVSPGYTPWSLVACDNDGSFIMMVTGAGWLYTSSDSWATWRISQSAGPYSGIACDADGSNLICCTSPLSANGQIFTSSDSGINWTERNPAGGTTSRGWTSVSSDSDGSFLVATCSNSYPPSGPSYGGRVYTSSDSGATWTERRPDGNTDYAWLCSACSADGSFIAVGVGANFPHRSRLYTSSDYGTNWTERRIYGDHDCDWIDVAVDDAGKKIFVLVEYNLGGRKLFLSSDAGATWIEQIPSTVANPYWQSLAISGDGLSRIAGMSSGRIYTYV
jgi:photosystem II stability/assembly factor-like uncharacterized protein